MLLLGHRHGFLFLLLDETTASERVSLDSTWPIDVQLGCLLDELIHSFLVSVDSESALKNLAVLEFIWTLWQFTILVSSLIGPFIRV